MPPSCLQCCCCTSRVWGYTEMTFCAQLHQSNRRSRDDVGGSTPQRTYGGHIAGGVEVSQVSFNGSHFTLHVLHIDVTPL